MAHVTSQPVKISCWRGFEHGLLVFVDDVLVGTISHLQQSVDETFRGQWLAERIGCADGCRQPVFASQEEALDYFRAGK